MERWQLADIVPTSKALLNALFWVSGCLIFIVRQSKNSTSGVCGFASHAVYPFPRACLWHTPYALPYLYFCHTTRGTLPAAPPCPPAPQAFRPSRCPCHERQPETFAKPAIDGASAARRHLGKPTILCLINHLATRRRRSILVFRLPLRFCKDFSLKPFSHVSGCVWAWWKNKPPLVHRLNQRKPCHATPLRCHAFGKHRQRAHPHAVIAV